MAGWAVLALVVLGSAFLTVERRSAGADAPTPARDARRDPESGLPLVSRAELPAEGRATLALITQGGPFPYPRDGATFQNRERLLPQRPAGTYREYTVPTPGATTRGARRIVAESRRAYYTADHYRSFARVEDWP